MSTEPEPPDRSIGVPKYQFVLHESTFVPLGLSFHPWSDVCWWLRDRLLNGNIRAIVTDSFEARVAAELGAELSGSAPPRSRFIVDAIRSEIRDLIEASILRLVPEAAVVDAGNRLVRRYPELELEVHETVEVAIAYFNSVPMLVCDADLHARLARLSTIEPRFAATWPPDLRFSF